jgi:hypothetical protein
MRAISRLFRQREIASLLLAMLIATGSLSAGQQTPSAPPRDANAKPPAIVIHAFNDGLSGVHAANPDVKLSVGHDSVLGAEPFLIVDYPAPTGEPAARDVACDAVNRDWSSGRAIAFRIKPSHALRLSVSFADRNHVIYTRWTALKADVWQPVSIPFDAIRPNPYFQPPDAKTGAALDVSDVGRIAFAPQDATSGRLAITTFTVTK